MPPLVGRANCSVTVAAAPAARSPALTVMYGLPFGGLFAVVPVALSQRGVRQVIQHELHWTRDRRAAQVRHRDSLRDLARAAVDRVAAALDVQRREHVRKASAALTGGRVGVLARREPRFDRGKDRRRVHRRAVDEPLARERRDHDAGHALAGAPDVARGRRDVIPAAAVFVVGDDDRGVRPERPGCSARPARCWRRAAGPSGAPRNRDARCSRRPA